MLNDPEPDWAYLDQESGYTEEELNTGDPKTLPHSDAWGLEPPSLTITAQGSN